MKKEKGGILEIFLIGLMIMLSVGIIVALICVIASNVDYGEREGIVIDKQYCSAYTTTTFVYTGKVMIPNTQYYPEKWKIQIKKEINKEEKSIWTSVDENTYNNIKIGDYYKETE